MINDDLYKSHFDSKSLFENLARRSKPKVKPKPIVTSNKSRPLNKPVLKTLMKAKELDTKINLLRSQGKSPRDFVDLLDEFQRNSTQLEVESSSPITKGSNNESNKGRR
jgi:hypothetical protein|tara:strand:+ start:566 stop:892 length:327 start_codon:yes stop_codon:yes gene_type:complete